MSALAPTVEAFFTERLLHQLQASPRTIAAYRDTLRLLLGFAAERTGKPPSELGFDDLDADLVTDFLTHLERQRHNSIRTRNARLAAIRSLFRFAALRHPDHAGQIQRVLAIPAKRHQRGIVSYLASEELDALLDAPDRSSWHGRRDQALLVLAVQTGLRVSELTALTLADIELGLAAIRSLFRFAALQHPEHAGQIQRVLAIPPKRHRRGRVLPHRRGNRRPAGRARPIQLARPPRPRPARTRRPNRAAGLRTDRADPRRHPARPRRPRRCTAYLELEISRAMPSAGLCRAAIRRTRDALSSKGIWAWGRWAARHNPGG